ncbi:MAG: hypothetical protein QXE81_03405 [Desulfurococcaceae archaeon]
MNVRRSRKIWLAHPTRIALGNIGPYVVVFPSNTYIRVEVIIGAKILCNNLLCDFLKSRSGTMDEAPTKRTITTPSGVSHKPIIPLIAIENNICVTLFKTH